MIENKAAPAEASYAAVVRRFGDERHPRRRVVLHRSAAEQASIGAVQNHAHPREIAPWRHLAQRHRREATPTKPRRDEPEPQTPTPVPEPRPTTSDSAT